LDVGRCSILDAGLQRKGDGLVVSEITAWEIGMHTARGRIQLAVAEVLAVHRQEV